MKEQLKKTPYVFVYGTLMKGLGNHGLISRSDFIGAATTDKKYTLEAKGIPFLKADVETSHVRGEVYEVSERVLRKLDQLEGHPGWYRREVIYVVDELGDKIKAWVYFMPNSEGFLHSGGEVIESGDYREYAEAS